MNYLDRLLLLQQLAEKLDNKIGTDLESRAFECIIEMINENIQNNRNSLDVVTNKLSITKHIDS